MGKHASKPFNPDIANAFFRAGKIEAWGRGIELIFSACRAAGVPKPALRYEPSGLWVEFSFPKSPKRPPGKSSVKSSAKTSAKTSVKILELLKEHPDMTLGQVAEIIGKTKRAIELASSKLVKAGRLRYVGPQKDGHWEVLT